jgi:glycosyltransferase involved in cell wall biosynthesis
VDDGSTDRSVIVLRELRDRDPGHVSIISFRRNYGKSAALQTGFKAVDGDVVITMDADLQDDPGEIPNLIAKLDSGADLVSGWKKNRHDPVTKTAPSKVFNTITSMFSGIKLHDFNCGLKAYRRDVVDSLTLYGELHRFIPVLAGWEGFKVDEIEVQHARRKYGKSKYGARRFLNGFFDLITVMFVTRRALNPLHFFGRIAIVLFVVGMIPLVVFFIQWIGGSGLRIRPIMLMGFVFVIVSLQIASIGLLAEMISSRSAKDSVYAFKEYSVRDVSEPPPTRSRNSQ